jgi:hypothetical protein
MDILNSQIMRTFAASVNPDTGVWLERSLNTWDAEIAFLLEQDIIYLKDKHCISVDIGDSGLYDIYCLTEKGIEYLTFLSKL